MQTNTQHEDESPTNYSTRTLITVRFGSVGVTLAGSACRVRGVESLSCNSVMARSVVTKFGACFDTKQRCTLHRSCLGQISIFAGTHVQIYTFLYLRHDSTECAEIGHVVRNRLARHFAEVNGGVQVHMRTPPPFPYLGNGGRIVMKFCLVG